MKFVVTENLQSMLGSAAWTDHWRSVLNVSIKQNTIRSAISLFKTNTLFSVYDFLLFVIYYKRKVKIDHYLETIEESITSRT